MNPDLAQANRARVEEFRRKHRTGLVALVFTDIVGSTALKQALGDCEALARIQQHHALVRALLRAFADAEEVSTAGDSFFLVFSRPSDAVRFALQLQHRLRELARDNPHPIQDRIGIHLGEVVVQQDEGRARDVHGLQVDLAARVMSLAEGGQNLLSRSAFDNARQALRGEELHELNELKWLNHGPYLLKGVDEPVEICEVGEAGLAALKAPADGAKAQRKVSADEEPVLGWRPAVGQMVPNTKWVLEQKLGEGGFGEVWLGRHQAMKERRVFKFCFRADRVRSLKREMTLFRVLKERVGDHPNIVRLLEVYFDEPPFYVVMDHVAGQDLKPWCEQQGGVGKVPLAARLEIVAQIADALQAAHDAGVIHRDVKPGNILVSRRGETPSSRDLTESPKGMSGLDGVSPYRVQAKLTDFGIGQVVSEEALKGVTKAGFTQTIVAESSSSQTGSQMYMAPELLAGKPASIRSDIYSLGVVLYQLLVGDFTRPITTDWQQDVADPLLSDDLKHCFAGNPQDRFTGAAQLARQLRDYEKRKLDRAQREAEDAEHERLRQQSIKRHRIVWVSAVVTGGVLLLALALGYGLSEARRNQRELERHLYAADVKLAQEALNVNDLGRAKRLLEQYRSPRKQHLRGWEWRYLWQECQSDALGELCRYSNSVYSVAFAPDGKLLASAGWSQGFVELWDVPNRKRIATLQENEGHLVAFSPRGNLLAANAARGVIRIWHTGTTNLVRQITHPDWVKVLKFSPDGTRLASLNDRGEVTVWEVDQWTVVHRIPGARSIGLPLGSLDFSQDGKVLAIGENRQLRVVDLDTGNEHFNITAHSEPISFVAWSPKAPIIASGSAYSSGLIRLWDAGSGQPIGTLDGHTSWVCELIFSADGQRLYSASADQTVRIWDVRQQRCLATLRGSTDEVYGLALSPDGATLVSATKDGVVAFWSALPRSEEEQPRLLSLGKPARPAFAPDSRGMAVAREGTVSLYDLVTFREIERIPALGTNTVSVAYSPDGTLLSSGGTDGRVRVWSCAERRLQRELAGHEQGILFAGFVADGTRLLSVDVGGKGIWWEVRTWQPLRSLVTESPSSGALSPDGRLLVTGNPKGLVSWWNAESGKLLASTVGHRHGVVGVACSPDGARVASVSEDGTIALWNASTFRTIVNFKGHMLAADSAAFSPDGRRLATGGSDREAVKLWDLSTYRELVTLYGRGSEFYYVSFTPDGNWVAACNWSAGQLHFWHAPMFAELDAIEQGKSRQR